MTPGESSKAGNVLVIDHPEGGRRIAAHVFDTPGGGIAWVDSGWTDPDNASHTVHTIDAEFAEFSMGWGGTRPDGEDVFIEVYQGKVDQEGSRERARDYLQIAFRITVGN